MSQAAAFGKPANARSTSAGVAILCASAAMYARSSVERPLTVASQDAPTHRRPAIHTGGRRAGRASARDDVCRWRCHRETGEIEVFAAGHVAVQIDCRVAHPAVPVFPTPSSGGDIIPDRGPACQRCPVSRQFAAAGQPPDPWPQPCPCPFPPLLPPPLPLLELLVALGVGVGGGGGSCASLGPAGTAGAGGAIAGGVALGVGSGAADFFAGSTPVALVGAAGAMIAGFGLGAGGAVAGVVGLAGVDGAGSSAGRGAECFVATRGAAGVAG